MKKINIRTSLYFVFILITFYTLIPTSVLACTIASVVASDGQVWNCNNEDGPIGVANFINVFPKSENKKYGYFALSYFSPKHGEGAYMQGGMIEAGLTFDFNAISRVKDFNPESKNS